MNLDSRGIRPLPMIVYLFKEKPRHQNEEMGEKYILYYCGKTGWGTGIATPCSGRKALDVWLVTELLVTSRVNHFKTQ